MKLTSAPRRGAVMLGFLVLLAASGWTVVEWSQAAAHARQRADEAQLLWAGQQYRQAIESYYNGTPRGVRQLPATMDDLIEDRRFPKPVRHLRRLYTDPMTPGGAWVVVRRGTQIIGVSSSSRRTPFRRVDFEPGLEKFSEAETYADWVFLANLRGAAALPAVAPATAPVTSPVTGAAAAAAAAQ